MTYSTLRLRLPADLPVRPRLATRPHDKDGWMNREVAVAGQTSCARQPIDLDHSDRFVEVWHEHVPHTGRRPPQKGVANFRGSTTDDLRREIVLESTLEQAGAAILLADRKVTRLRSQVGPVDHVDEFGKEKRPVFDFVADTVRGSDLAIAIKPERKRLPSGIDGTIERVRAQRPDFVDEAAVWTEAQLSRCEEHNAGLILRSRRLRNEAEIASMRALAEQMRGVFPLGQLVRSGGSGALEFAAAVNLIDQGVLVPVELGRIRPELRVRLAT